MKTITLRNLDKSLERALVEKAELNSASLSSTVLMTLREAFGLQKRPRRQRNAALEKLAGAWTKGDLKQFESATSDFSKIDEELWK